MTHLMYDVDGLQWHGYQANDEICHGQREEKVIGYGLQLLVHLEADHDHEIASNGDQAQEPRSHTDQNGLQQSVGLNNDGWIRT